MGEPQVGETRSSARSPRARMAASGSGGSVRLATRRSAPAAAGGRRGTPATRRPRRRTRRGGRRAPAPAARASAASSLTSSSSPAAQRTGRGPLQRRRRGRRRDPGGPAAARRRRGSRTAPGRRRPRRPTPRRAGSPPLRARPATRRAASTSRSRRAPTPASPGRQPVAEPLDEPRPRHQSSGNPGLEQLRGQDCRHAPDILRRRRIGRQATHAPDRGADARRRGRGPRPRPRRRRVGGVRDQAATRPSCVLVSVASGGLGRRRGRRATLEVEVRAGSGRATSAATSWRCRAGPSSPARGPCGPGWRRRARPRRGRGRTS